MGISQEKEERQLILLFYDLKDPASIPTGDLIPTIRCGRNHHSLSFQTPLEELTFTRVHSSLKQSEVGMPFQIQLLPLLKMQRIVWLGLPLW